MKRLGSILSLTILIVLLSSSLCFASGLELIDSYPQDGSTGYQPENLAVKLYFNEDVSAKEVQKANQDAFKVTDSKGKEIPVRILYNSKNLDQIWVLIDNTLKPDSEYKLLISGDLKIANGDTLGKGKIIKFKTRNTQTDTTVNMVMMGVMMVGMVVFSSLSTKHNLKKQEEEKGEVEKVNPYKVAKETGKPVEAIVAKTEKEKERVKAKASKKQSQQSNHKQTVVKEEPGKDTKRVEGPRPISVTGSTYITGRKAAAEIAAAKAAAKAASSTTRPKSATGKSKNTKAKGHK